MLLQLLIGWRTCLYYLIPLGYLAVTVAGAWLHEDRSVQGWLLAASRTVKAVVDAADIPFKLTLYATALEVNDRWLRNAAGAAVS